jgi:hypothetical protein
VAYCLLGALNLGLLLKTYIQSEQKLDKAAENYAAIRTFLHNLYVCGDSARAGRTSGAGWD